VCRNTVCLALLCLLWHASTNAQSSAPPAAEFSFARLIYQNPYEQSRALVDWPAADVHFTRGVQRLTRIDAAPEGVLLSLDTQQLFDYPWLYVVETGYMWISEQEQAVLREYLLRGGFLLVDDFHGSHEWRHFASIMASVFPDRKIVDLKDNNEVFHLLFDLNDKQQIPGIHALLSNRTWENDGRTPHWRGIYDDRQRLMVAIIFNQDLGDAWEHADEPDYPQSYSSQAYRLGVNYLLYAMTH